MTAAGETRSINRGSLRLVLVSNLGTRLVTLPVSSVAGLATIALTVHAIGAARYGAVALVGTTILLLVPITDFGRGAVVINAFSASDAPGSDRAVLAAVGLSVRYLSSVGAALATAGLVISATGLWGRLLGPGGHSVDHLGRTMAIAGLLVGVSIPMSLGARALVGLGRNHTATALAIVSPLVAFAWTASAAFAGAAASWYAVAMPVGFLIQSLLQASVALRCAGMRLGAIAAVSATRAERHAARAIGRPMLLITVALPLAVQSDRIVLSHVRPAALPVYALVAQLYSPLYSMLSTVGAALWPYFAYRRRAGAAPIAAWYQATAALGAIGLTEGAGLFLLGRPAASYIGDGRVTPTLGLLAAFGALLSLQGLQLASGVYLTRAAELRVQAVCTAVALPINLLLSVSLTARYGAVGPVLGTALCLTFIQWLPLVPRVLRDRTAI